MNSKFSPRLLLATLVVVLGGAGTVFAINSERCRYGGGQMEHRMAHAMKAMSRLHDELKLDATQQALWQQAEEGSRSAIGDMREQLRKKGEEALAAVSRPGADLRAVLQQMEPLKELGRQQQAVVRDRWLGVYDALDAAQKEKARLFFKSRLEAMSHRGGFGGGPADD